MSKPDSLLDAPRRSVTRRNIKILLGLTIINTVLILGVGLSTMSEPVNCNNSILLDGDGMAHSDYHENKDIAEEDLLARVTKEVELWSAKKISMYRCPGMCPEKFSNRAIMDIRNIRHHFSPPPGENTAKWSATGSYVWHANLSCS